MSTPAYPPEPEPLTEAELVQLWRENNLLRAGYPDTAAAKIAASDADLHRAIDLLHAGCTIDIAVEILT